MDNNRRGVWYGFIAYFLWGMFPLYFQLLTRSGAFEIVAYRVICSLVFCLLALAVLRQWRQVRRVLANRRATIVLALAGILVAGNWTLYVWGVNNGFAIDAALGYFINPLVNATFGVVLLGERMRRLQWVAFGIGTLAVVVLIVAYGRVPWVAIGLALTFGLYGLLKKRVGAAVPPLAGLTVESCAATPFAIAYLAWLAAVGQGTVNPLSGYGALMALAGPVTAIPLLLFAAATARVRLSTMGILQYVAPILQFLIGWLIIGEQMPPARWLGFSIIWVALVIFVVDALRDHSAGRDVHAD
ncbi:EamA family transporter RarD [Brooklawnia cerclae]|uniref:Chloramphenicol-sensitive protein RarD n=1 Tax=Brooklawnia cerclae TaxID=349934 RepID=A0ABX0SAH2_9ACTN|nr:chloramphenicol-sensitive protein RarD [Brooklawnia cerclae]